MSTQTPDVFMVSAGRGISLNLLQNTSMSGIVGHSYPWTSFVYAKLYLKKTKQRHGKGDSWNQVCAYHREHPDEEVRVTSTATQEQWGEGDLSCNYLCFRSLKNAYSVFFERWRFFLFPIQTEKPQNPWQKVCCEAGNCCITILTCFEMN